MLSACVLLIWVVKKGPFREEIWVRLVFILLEKGIPHGNKNKTGGKAGPECRQGLSQGWRSVR